MKCTHALFADAAFTIGVPGIANIRTPSINCLTHSSSLLSLTYELTSCWMPGLCAAGPCSVCCLPRCAEDLAERYRELLASNPAARQFSVSLRRAHSGSLDDRIANALCQCCCVWERLVDCHDFTVLSPASVSVPEMAQEVPA